MQVQKVIYVFILSTDASTKMTQNRSKTNTREKNELFNFPQFAGKWLNILEEISNISHNQKISYVL